MHRQTKTQPVACWSTYVTWLINRRFAWNRLLKPPR